MNITHDKIANPLNYFARPTDIEKDTSLSVEDKIKLLANWLDDVKLRQIAEAENMPGNDEQHTYIADIERLLHKYQLLKYQEP